MARVSLGIVGSLAAERRARKPRPEHRKPVAEHRRGYMRKRREARKARVAENVRNLGTWPFPPVTA